MDVRRQKVSPRHTRIDGVPRVKARQVARVILFSYVGGMVKLIEARVSAVISEHDCTVRTFDVAFANNKMTLFRCFMTFRIGTRL